MNVAGFLLLQQVLRKGGSGYGRPTEKARRAEEERRKVAEAERARRTAERDELRRVAGKEQLDDLDVTRAAQQLWKEEDERNEHHPPR